MPSIRAVALELSISVITIKKAWEMLERQGFIYTIAGKGCYVATLTADERNNKRIELATAKISSSIGLMKRLELSKADIISIIKDIY